jgi:hypothetical protein
MTPGAIKYISPFIIYLGSLLSFSHHGFLIWIPVIYAWIIIPVTEPFICIFLLNIIKGHHKRVATPEDPSSARLGECVYIFYFRSIIFSYLSAWSIANKDIKKKERAVYSLFNEMIQFQLIQAAFILIIYFMFGWFPTLW